MYRLDGSHATRFFKLVNQVKQTVSWSSPFSSLASPTTDSAMSISKKRALLYTPAHDQRKIQKAASHLKADVVCLDCEDAVAENRKEDARYGAVHALDTYSFVHSHVAVRLNAIQTGFCRADFDCVWKSRVLPKIIVLPKVDSVDNLNIFYSIVKDASHALPRHDDSHKQLELVLMCESAIGLINLHNIFLAAKQNGLQNFFQLSACIFGGDDYASSIGAIRTKDSLELLYARQAFVTACKAHNLQAIDIVKIDYKDTQALLQESQLGRSFGFTGKQIIHPNQIDVVQAAFTPSKEELDRARQLVAIAKEFQDQGTGAFSYQNMMIDAPTISNAKNLLAQFDRGTTS